MFDLINRQKCIDDCLRLFPECSNVVDMVIKEQPSVDVKSMLNTNSKKTADQMFMEMGYRRNDDLALKLEGSRNAKVCYHNEEFCKAIAFSVKPVITGGTQIYIKAYYVDDTTQYTDYTLGLWDNELNACAKLIREMEAEHD